MDDKAVDRAIREVQGGKTDCYEIVVKAYERRLRGLVASLCPQGVDADEISQDAFVEAYKKIDYYEPGTNFFAWLSTFARNLLLSHIRKYKRELAKKRKYVEHIVATQLSESAEKEFTGASERISALNSCLKKLENNQARLLKMHYEKDMRFSALAEHFNTTANALKVRMFGIRKKLRSCVNRHLREQGVQIESP